MRLKVLVAVEGVLCSDQKAEDQTAREFQGDEESRLLECLGSCTSNNRLSMSRKTKRKGTKGTDGYIDTMPPSLVLLMMTTCFLPYRLPTRKQSASLIQGPGTVGRHREK